MHSTSEKRQQPLSVTVQAAVKMTGLSKTTIYALRKEGVLRTTQVRNRRLILFSDLTELLHSGMDDAQ